MQRFVRPRRLERRGGSRGSSGFGGSGDDGGAGAGVSSSDGSTSTTTSGAGSGSTSSSSGTSSGSGTTLPQCAANASKYCGCLGSYATADCITTQESNCDTAYDYCPSWYARVTNSVCGGTCPPC